jgi:hypothetical protein
MLGIILLVSYVVMLCLLVRSVNRHSCVLHAWITLPYLRGNANASHNIIVMMMIHV